MKTSFLVMTTVLLVAVFTLFGCKKSDTPTTPPKEDTPPATAPVETE